MKPIKVRTTVDEATDAAIPAFRSLLGKRVELTARPAEEGGTEASNRKLTLLARRFDAPADTAPLTEQDIQRAILEGSVGGNLRYERRLRIITVMTRRKRIAQ